MAPRPSARTGPLKLPLSMRARKLYCRAVSRRRASVVGAASFTESSMRLRAERLQPGSLKRALGAGERPGRGTALVPGHLHVQQRRVLLAPVDVSVARLSLRDRPAARELCG